MASYPAVQRVRNTQETGGPVVAGTATVTGATIDTQTDALGPFARFRASVFADQVGTIFVDQSRDGATWRQVGAGQANTANQLTVYEVLISRRYVRGRFVNGAAATTVFEFDTAALAI